MKNFKVKRIIIYVLISYIHKITKYLYLSYMIERNIKINSSMNWIVPYFWAISVRYIFMTIERENVYIKIRRKPNNKNLMVSKLYVNVLSTFEI